MFLMAVIAALGLGLLTGRNLSSLAQLRITGLWAPLGAYLIQYGLDYLAGQTGQQPWMGLVHTATYVLLFYWVYENRPVPGMGLLGLGMLLNVTVIALNHGMMPVDPEPLSASAYSAFASGLSGTHILLDSGTRATWLADIIYLPWPQRELDSLGDLLLAAGGFWLLFRGMGNQARGN
ncbi:MAG TPA: DUF5317 family protein [Bacillota bacterium]|nr:DUF5317 family protein [Bacillota bacterium]